MEKKILVNYSLLRILAIFLVIATHMLAGIWIADPVAQPMAWHIREIIRTLTLTSNGLFFMLSGRFILERFDGDIPGFYWKRIVKIGIPSLFAAFLYYAQNQGISLSPAYFKDFFKGFLQARVVGYLWFVLALAGFYLAVPFLWRMFQHMGKRELWWLLFVSLFYFAVQNLYQIFHMEQMLTSYFLYSWVFYCILGFLLDRLDLTGRQVLGFFAAGLLAFFLSSLEEIYFTGQNPAIYNYAPSMILMSIAVYLLVTRYGGLVARPLEKPVNFVSRYIFFVYLFHGMTHNFIFDHLVEPGIPGYGAWLLLSLLSFCLALGLSIPVYHVLYQPFCKVLLSLPWPGKDLTL